MTRWVARNLGSFSMAQNLIELTKHDFSPELEKALDVFNNYQLGEKDSATGGCHG
jgi:hypothetical protein